MLGSASRNSDLIGLRWSCRHYHIIISFHWDASGIQSPGLEREERRHRIDFWKMTCKGGQSKEKVNTDCEGKAREYQDRIVLVSL